MKKMTKEECLKALNNLSRYANIGRAKHGAGGCVVDNFVSNNEAVIYNLICGNFDNPPLEFEELKEKTWYWHNPSKSWIYLFKPLNWEPEKGLRYAERIIDRSAEGYYMPFKTGTLFRKQVEE